MNIALFDAAPYWSGGAERIYFCCKEYKNNGHRVILFCLPSSRLNLLLKDEIEIYNICPRYDLDVFSFLKIFEIIKKQKIDILDVHSPKYYWICLLIAKLVKSKIILTRNVIYRKTFLKKVINKYLFSKYDFIVGVSEKVKQIFLDDYNISKNKIEVIYDGVDVKKFDISKGSVYREEIRKKYNINYTDFVIITIGRIEKIKGYDVIIESIKQIRSIIPHLKLMIIGKVEDKKYFKKLTNLVKLGDLSKEIVFIEFQENVIPFIYASDIIVSTSYYESLGKSLLEAVLCKKPFVAMDNCGIKELFSEEYGVYVEVGNKNKFTEGILKVFNNYDFYVKNLLKLDTKKFDYKNMTDKYLNIYEKILNYER